MISFSSVIHCHLSLNKGRDLYLHHSAKGEAKNDKLLIEPSLKHMEGTLLTIRLQYFAKVRS